jgi:hypothetical protein
VHFVDLYETMRCVPTTRRIGTDPVSGEILRPPSERYGEALD